MVEGDGGRYGESMRGGWRRHAHAGNQDDFVG